MPLTPLQVLNTVVDNRVATAKLTGFRTLANLAAKGRVKSYRKTQINWDVDTGGEAAAWEAMTADGADTTGGNTVPALLTIGAYRLKHQFSISKVAIQEAAQVAPEDLADLFGAHTDRAVNSIFRKLNAALFLGDGTATHGGLVGLSKILDNTYAYAGIDPATYTSWVTLLNTNATDRAFTRALMLDVDQAVSENETAYDMVVTTPSLGTAYTKVFDTIAGVQSTVTTADSKLPMVDLGHSGRMYNGYPIIEDPVATAKRIHLINSNDLELKLFELANSPDNPDKGQHIVNRGYDLPIHIAELPSQNSAVRRFEFFVIPQLKLHNRKSLICIDKIT
jgi:hypothetical protein